MNYKGIKDIIYVCNYCKQEFKRKYYSTKPPKYCSNRCQHDERKENSIDRVAEGQISDSSTLRRVLSDLFGYLCSTCGVTEWQGQPITLHVDHIDGNPDNNKTENLRLLCPNCHSQTPTYKGGNKNNPKKDKRSRYHRNYYAKAKASLSERAVSSDH